MICPLKFNSNTTDADGAVRKDVCLCEREDCAWWNEYFGKCSIAVESYLRGIEDHRVEIKQAMRDRW